MNINPQSNTDFTQVTCTIHFYYMKIQSEKVFFDDGAIAEINCYEKNIDKIKGARINCSNCDSSTRDCSTFF